MGKTTLLYRVYRELKREGDPVAFLDLSTYHIDSVSQSYSHAALKIWEELSEMLFTPGKLRAVAGAVNGPIRFREFLLDLVPGPAISSAAAFTTAKLARARLPPTEMRFTPSAANSLTVKAAPARPMTTFNGPSTSRTSRAISSAVFWPGA